MRSFMYGYEAELLEYFSNMIPGIKELTYSDDFEFIGSMTPKKEYPSAYYNRTTESWTHPVLWKFSNLKVDGVGNAYFENDSTAILKQHYKVRVYCKTQGQALALSARFKATFPRTIRVPWEFSKDYIHGTGTTTEFVDVVTFVTGVTVGEERRPNDKSGSQRYVEIDWESQMFYMYTPEYDEGTALVEQVNVYFTTSGAKVIQNADISLSIISGEKGVFSETQEESVEDPLTIGTIDIE